MNATRTVKGRPPPRPGRPTWETPLLDFLGTTTPDDWPPIAERHSRGATRCGLCGELTEAPTCCGVAVY